jgi:hypothetical protein
VTTDHCVEDLLVVNTATYRYFSCGGTKALGAVFFATPGPAESTVPRPVEGVSETRRSSGRVGGETMAEKSVKRSGVETSSASVVGSTGAAATVTVVRSGGAWVVGNGVFGVVAVGFVLLVGGWL